MSAITYADLKNAGIKNKTIEAALGISNAANLAKNFSDKHQAKALELLNQYRDAAEVSAAPALPVDDAIGQREIAQAETQALKGLVAVAGLTSQIEQLCNAGLYLVPIPPINDKPTKAPIATGWNKSRSGNNPHGYSNNPADFINCKEGYNIGLCHKPSGTAGIDIDDLNACLPLFETVGLDLSGWLNDQANVKIESGKPNRAKILFRLPESCDPIITRQYSHNKTMLFEIRHSAKTGATVQDVIAGVHPETGTNYRVIGDIANIPIIPDELLDVALFWDDWKPVFDSVLGVVEQPKEAPRKPLEGENLKGYRNPIVEYNAKHTVREVLERNGYRPVGTDRYIRPNSSSHAPGIKILTNCRDGKERAWSFGGDALNTGFALDAFDVFRWLEHSGAW